MWTIVISFLIKLIEMWIDKKKADRELAEAFKNFQKAFDTYRSLKVHESALSQRERLKIDEKGDAKR